jgi:antitoxin ParD1/3/4
MGTNVNLTPQLEELIRTKVASGMYGSASEVVREALRLLDERDSEKALRLELLRSEIREGLSSGPGQRWSADEIKAEGRARRAVRGQRQETGA